MRQLYCPNCATVQNAYCIASKETMIPEDGESFLIVNTNYYCEECNIFLESEIKPDKYSDYENII